MEKFYKRFLGYADIYDEGRPKLPKNVFEILKIYRNNINTIVDIGCGTGLSTEVCCKYANKVIGIEPSVDMLNIAKTKENDILKFRQGLGNDTGLEDDYADIVICSQAFHWMETDSTLKEVYRILKKGGIFAIIDAQYPPIINIELEMLNNRLNQKIANLEKDITQRLNKKSEYLEDLIKCNLFIHARKIYFSNIEKYDKKRFKKYILSQSGIQQAIQNNYNIIKEELENLDFRLDSIFNEEELDALYSYKMIIGVK